MGYTPHILVIGGGVLGTAIARDLALRGLEVTVVEQGTLAAGTTGRMQGLLFSGARFASTDPGGAKRCRRESYILRRIADHYVADTGGVLAPAPGREDAFDDHLDAIDDCGITHDEIRGADSSTAGLADAVDRAVRVPDASIDPFRLTLATAEEAENFGAEIKTGARVTDVHREGDRVTGVTVEYVGSDAEVRVPTDDVSPETKPSPDDEERSGGPDGEETVDANGSGEEAEDEETDEDDDEEMPGEIQRSFPGVEEDARPEAGETEELEADFVVNAAGAWADRIAALAGIDLPLSRARGRMLVLDDAPESVLTRWDPGGSPLALTPYWDNGILGPILETDGTSPAERIDATLDTVEGFVPSVSDGAVLRSYSGVWTQHASSSSDPYGPGATLVDHDTYDDCWGMLSVLGGTVTTHRFVAERAVDRVCDEFGIDRECMTADIELPDIDVERSESAAGDRSGAATDTVTPGGVGGPVTPNPVICEHRDVRRKTITTVFDDDDVLETNLDEVRIRTGATMGACQGGRCGHRIAALLHPKQEVETVDESLRELLARRWRGRRQTLWGEQLAGALDDYALHAQVLNRGVQPDPEAIDLDRFDAGPDPEQREKPNACEAMKR